MILLSIIIPVYNSSRYLKECLNSVLSQTFSEMEIICINDGSTDQSLAILKKYSEEDSRFIIIDQENKGVSAARNAALEIASGKYIGFVDSDDTIESDFFQQLFTAAEKNDVDVVYSANPEGNLMTNNAVFHREEITSDILPLFYKGDAYNAIWNKLYRNTTIKTQRLRFNPEIIHGEDRVFNIEFLLHAKSVCFLNYHGYHYRETAGSATRNISQHDYLTYAVRSFITEEPQLLKTLIEHHRLHHLKKERFINTMISLVYLYADPSNGLPLQKRMKKLSELVDNPLVKRLFNEENDDMTAGFPKYLREVYSGIRNQSVIKLYLLSLYSYYRNQ